MLNKDLNVIHSDLASTADYSQEAREFLRDNFALSFDVDTSLFIGLYKPFSQVYFDLNSYFEDSEEITFLINGQTIIVDDGTRNFTRGGFVEFGKPDDWAKETINGKELYFVELKFNNALATFIDFKAINLLFSEDNDINQEEANLDRLLAKGDTNFNRYHLAARNEIVQTYRNGGNYKKVTQDDKSEQIENITQWDIIDIGDIKQASKYLTLAKLYDDLSENVDDKSAIKSRRYMDKYGKAFDLFFNRLDLNDDGDYKQEDELILNNVQIEIV